MKYLVKIFPVSRHESAIVKLILKIVGPNEAHRAKKLARKGGVITENLNKEAATNLANQLKELGAQVEVEEMKEIDDDNTDLLYKVVLVDAGTNKLRVIKVVREVTGLGLKESKEIVDKLGVVNEKLSKKIAEKIKERLEAIGAEVKIERDTSTKPDPKDDPLEPLDTDNDGNGNKGAIIFGKVLKADQQPLSGVSVRAFDKNLKKDIHLGLQTKTNQSGDYEIAYTSGELPRGKDLPDIYVMVLDEKGKSIGKSPIKYNAPAEVKINILLPPQSLTEEDEYTMVKQELKRYMGDNESLADLEESEERQEVTYLANKSGWDARLVAMASLAEKYEKETNTPASYYYALFRAGYPTDRTRLSKLSPNIVGKVWEQAGKENIISPDLDDQIEDGVKVFTNNSASYLLKQPANSGISGLNEMLDLADLNEEEKLNFTHIYLNTHGDSEALWKQVEQEFGKNKTNRLQTDGRLGYLTMDNAPLIKELRNNNLVKDDPVQLIENGLYSASAWEELLNNNNIEVPTILNGDSIQEKKAEYSDQMATKLKISYPTAVLSQQIKRGEMPVHNNNLKEDVAKFLQQNQKKYQIGEVPLATYLKENNINLDISLQRELFSLERVYKITPSDEAMKVMINNGFDSAMSVTRLDQKAYVEKFSQVMGGEEKALRSYQVAQQVHATTLNAAVAYLTYKRNPGIRTIASDPTPPSDILAYPTLDRLFGEMDYCECSHCRSVLSPAAYMVDLLNFIDKPGEDGTENPLEVLLERRPDIEHLQLTCENTNTVLPYIDLVNEILEHFTVHANQAGVDPAANDFNPLEGFNGYNMDTYSDTSELISSPKYVKREAYEILKREVHPAPFNQPLEALRLLFKELEVTLGKAIELFRRDDNAETWRPVHLERLGFSPEEYRILTDNEKTISEYYGKKAGINLNDVLNDDGKYAKHFTRSLHISYKELTDIVKTRFINPGAHLIPGLERLFISMPEINQLIDDGISNNDFNDKLPDDLDLDLYAGDVAKWIKQQGAAVKKLILLTDSDDGDDPCNFEKLELLFANGEKITQLEYLKFYRFVKTWKKLGWTVDQTDRTFAALWPEAEEVQSVEELNDGFKEFLNKLAHLRQVMDLLKMKPKKELQHALALFANIDTHGQNALYRQLFLNSALSEKGDIFEYNPNGEVLKDNNSMLTAHEEALLGALNISAEKFYLLLDRFVEEMPGVDKVDEIPLKLPVISKIYRYSLLARQLKISIEEVLILQDLSQINPFASLTPVKPPIVQFIEIARRLKDQKAKLTSLTFYLRHEDLSDESSPTETEIRAFARQLTAEMQRVEVENSIGGEATADLAKEKMGLLYDPETVNMFFSILNDDILLESSYDHHQQVLEEGITAVSNRLVYNNFRKGLYFSGIMTEAERDDLKDAGDVITDVANRTNFKDAIETLYDKGQSTSKEFFKNNPNLQNPYDNFTADGDYSKMMASIMLSLKEELKRSQAIQLIGVAHGADPKIVSALLEEGILDSETNTSEPAIADYLALEKNGLNVSIGLDDSSETVALWSTPQASTKGQELPANTQSLSFSFYVLASEGGFYNMRLETETTASVELLVDDESKLGSLSGTTWDNDEPIYLESNHYHRIDLTVNNISATATLKWAAENGSGSFQVLPSSVLFPVTTVDTFGTAYLRFLKALALMNMLDFSATEISYFGDTLQIGGDGFLKSIPLSFNKEQSDIHRQLFEHVNTQLYYKLLKEAFGGEPEEMISILNDPEGVIARPEGDNIVRLLKVTGWDEMELNILLARFGWEWVDLSDPENLYRVYEAYELVRETGLSASLLIEIASNDPDMADITSIENAIRIKYDNAGWLKIIQPINDKLRNMQRDALVAYVLRLLSKNPLTGTVDTADKLFEYFLIDVEMDACMKTSRIKQAISSIQLFVNRCLLNLEANVSSASILKKQWIWMKRYRVWEANRKVFLYPENWLEPELRDNKSSFFKELEGELLQSEINEDTAHSALLHYLEKLDTVAKLEICAYYLDEKETGNEADDILHVIGRTSGAKRLYYYRRLEYGYWTTWEKIDAEIEDNPILPVVWNGRLFLFWLMVVTQGEENTDVPATEENGKIKPRSKDIKVRLEVTLCWSEYYNKKWQPKNTSNINNPLVFSNVHRNFKRSEYFNLKALKGEEGELYIQIKNQSKKFNSFHWKLFNKHSHPQINYNSNEGWLQKQFRTIDSEGGQISLAYNSKYEIEKFTITGRGTFRYSVQIGDPDFSHMLYQNFSNASIISPSQAVNELFESPFFIQNYRHVFYVKPEKYFKPIWILDYGYEPPAVIYPPPAVHIPIHTFPPIWIDKPKLEDIPLDRDPVFDIDTDSLTQPQILPGEFKFLESFHNIKKGMLSKNFVLFGDAVILPSGNANRIILTEDSIKNL